MTKPACYQPIPPFRDKRSLNFRFSPIMGKSPSPWPEGKWTRNIKHIEQGIFDSASQQQMKTHWAIINPVVKELPDVIGEFSYSESQFLALCTKLKDAIEAADPDLCSFLPMERLYDLRHDRIIDEPKYFYTAVRQHKYSLDLDAGDADWIGLPDGSTMPTLLPSSRIHPSALEGAMLWRDEKSKEVLYDHRFKSLAENAGCVGMYFYEMKLSQGG